MKLIKLSVNTDSLLYYYYQKIKCFTTELREHSYVKHSIVKHFWYQYQWLWMKFWQRYVNLPKLQHGKVWNSDGDIKTPLTGPHYMWWYTCRCNIWSKTLELLQSNKLKYFHILLCKCLTLFQVLQTLILPFHYCTHSERIDTKMIMFPKSILPYSMHTL